MAYAKDMARFGRNMANVTLIRTPSSYNIMDQGKATIVGVAGQGGDRHKAGDLLWYRHFGLGQLLPEDVRRWDGATTNPIGEGWGDMRKLVGRSGWLFAVDDGGQLLAYKYYGQGMPYHWQDWSVSGQVIGQQFDKYKMLTCGAAEWDDPVLYGVTLDGALHRGVYRPSGPPLTMHEVTTGWGDHKAIIGGDFHALFAITGTGDLLSYPSQFDQTYDPAPWYGLGQPVKIGSGWDKFEHVMAGGISSTQDFYAIAKGGNLYWYRFKGSLAQADPQSTLWDARAKIGNGW